MFRKAACVHNQQADLSMFLESVLGFYHGFYLAEPVGNNAFSFEKRKNKRLYVPPVVEGSSSDLRLGSRVVFSEIDDGEEKNYCGLEQFVYVSHRGKDLFIFDNHNHAFFFWVAACKSRRFAPGGTLLHIDQHSDMREPDHYLSAAALAEDDLTSVFDYTISCLNVGNFIKPALALGLFSKVEFVGSSSAFEKEFRPPFVLDIDIDVFAPEMAYIDHARKLARIREAIRMADFITIATSPFFIDQNDAIRVVHELLAADS